MNVDEIITINKLLEEELQKTKDELIQTKSHLKKYTAPSSSKIYYEKHKELGKGMRTLFRRNKYQVYLVDEHKTSCKCSKCEGGVCEKFMVRENPRPKKDELRLVHGLLRCKSGCGAWNRDRNGSSNIYKIACQAISKMPRPSYLCRTTNK